MLTPEEIQALGECRVKVEARQRRELHRLVQAAQPSEYAGLSSGKGDGTTRLVHAAIENYCATLRRSVKDAA